MASGMEDDQMQMEQSDLPFQLGDLVLCRYWGYPYWPAKVEKCHQQGAIGEFVRCAEETDGTSILVFWTTFFDGTAGWVRCDRMFAFHPEIVEKVRVLETNPFFLSQCCGLEQAESEILEVHRSKPWPPLPIPPEDLSDAPYLGGDEQDQELAERIHDLYDNPHSVPGITQTKQVSLAVPENLSEAVDGVESREESLSTLSMEP